jgi:tetratricopeptide (TPR) repeat protein
LAIYGQVLSHHFVNLDDDLYIYANPHVAGPLRWESLRWAFTAFHGGHWHPLTWLTHQLDWFLYGADAGRHIFGNVVLHFGNAVLVFGLLYGATRRPWASFFAALLFLAHPLRVESVAWASERKDVLSAFFALLACLFYSEYARGVGRARYALTTLCLVLGFLSKPTIVMMPALFWILDFWPLRREVSFRRRVAEKLPWAALAVGAGLAMLAAQRAAGAIQSLGDAPLAARLANASVSLVGYLWSTCVPTGLGAFYPMRPIGWAAAGASAAALTLLTAYAWRVRRERPYVAAGWAWYLAAILPTIGLVQVGAQAHADRFTYLPMLGPVIAAVWWWEEAPFPPALVKRLALAAAALGLASVSFAQVRYWRDSETLYRRTLQVAGDSALIDTNLGVVLSDRGAYDEAAEHYRAALSISPRYPEALNDLGVYYGRLGDLASARPLFARAVAEAPDVARYRYNFGLSLSGSDADAAAAQLERAISLDPAYPDPYLTLGAVDERRGDVLGARMAYERLVELRPESADARARLARAQALDPGPR